MSVPHLNHQHLRVLEEIFKHPVPHNLEWPDVFHLIEHLGSGLERHDGKYEFKVGDVTEVFTKPQHKDMQPDDVTRLRKMLAQAGVSPDTVQKDPKA